MTYRAESWMWSEAVALLDEAERRHRQFFALVTASAPPSWEPPINIFRAGAELHVIAALPGANAEDIAVHLSASGLHIETAVAPPAVGAGMEVVRLEIPYGRMRRRIDLPPGRYTLLETRLERGCLLLRLRSS